MTNFVFAHGQWFSPCTPASSTTKTGRHDIAEILLKVVLKHNKSIKKTNIFLNRIHNLFCRTSLHWAAAMGHQDCVLILLKLGVKPNVVDTDGFF
jgi:ankyrin repeat protein